jgi:uncharacterized membrane protein
MSEDPESAEESEKTQTTSDADSPGGSRKNSVKGIYCIYLLKCIKQYMAVCIIVRMYVNILIKEESK